MDLRSGSVIQYTAAGLVAGLGSLLFEEQRIDWTGELIFSLASLVLLLSLGAVSLLYWLIRRGQAARVSTLFVIVQPVTVLFETGWAPCREIVLQSGLFCVVPVSLIKKY